MKHKLLLLLVAIMTLALAVPALAAGLSQDPQAQYFVGSWEGTILAHGGQRSLEITISRIDDAGKVTVSRFHEGAVGVNLPAADIPVDSAVYQVREGKPAVVLKVEGQTGQATNILAREGNGLSLEIIGSAATGKIIHFDRMK